MPEMRASAPNPGRRATPLPTSLPAPRAPAADHTDAPGWDATLFVWAAWAVLFVAALGFVWKYGSSVPYFDEWDWLVPMIAGQESSAAEWLWKRYGYHYFPLPKVLLLTLIKVTGDDFRTAMYFHVLILGTLAAVMIRVARELRGRTSYADALFPVIFLHWGHEQILLTNMQIVHVLPLGIAGVLAVLVLRSRGLLAPAAAAVAGVCLLALPLSGGAGVLLVGPFGLWYAYAGLRQWRDPRPAARRGGLVAAGFLAALAALLLIYFTGKVETLGPTSRPSVPLILKTALEVLTVSLGAQALMWGLKPGWVVTVLLVLAAGLLAYAVANGPARDRPRALGLLLYLGFVGSFALLVGYQRPGFGFQDYYGLLPSLGVCVAYLAFGLYAPAAVGRLVQMSLFTLGALLFPLNLMYGIEHGHKFRGKMEAFEKDVQAGQPPYVLLARHFEALSAAVDEDDVTAKGLVMLRDAGISPFKLMGEDPPFREVPLAVVPADLNCMTWEGMTGTGTGEGYPHVEFALPELTYVAGIRMTFNHSALPEAHLCVSWKGEDPPDWPDVFQFQRTSLTPRPLMVWVGKKIDRFRIYPDLLDANASIEVLEITLLVPEAPARPPARPRR